MNYNEQGNESLEFPSSALLWLLLICFCLFSFCPWLWLAVYSVVRCYARSFVFFFFLLFVEDFTSLRLLKAYYSFRLDCLVVKERPTKARNGSFLSFILRSAFDSKSYLTIQWNNTQWERFLPDVAKGSASAIETRKKRKEAALLHPDKFFLFPSQSIGSPYLKKKEKKNKKDTPLIRFVSRIRDTISLF